MKISMSLEAIGFGVAAGLALVLVAQPSFADPPRLAIDAATDLSNAPGSQPSQLTSLGDRIVFTADDDDRDERLWTSDGTLDGTYALGPACDPGVYGQPWRRVGVLPGIAFFSFYCSGQGTSLWRTDGSAAGTYELLDYSLAEALVSAVEFADGLVFLEDDFEVGGASDRLRLWKTDGTLSGTRRVVDVPVGGLATFGLPVAASDRIEVIVRRLDALPELWMSAGADFTTGKVATLDAGFAFDYFPVSAAFGRHVAWRAYSSQLWVSDGTASGAGPVTAFAEPSNALRLGRLTPDGDRLLFVVATDGQGEEIWQSDGTPGGTAQLTDFEEPTSLQFLGGPRLLVPVGSRVVFFAGTSSGVSRLVAFDRADGSLAELAAPCGTLSGDSGCRYTLWLAQVGERVVFPMPIDEVGAIATSDGTPAGTGIAANLCPAGCNQQPFAVTEVGDRVFGLLGRSEGALELWSVDAQGEVTLHGGGFSRVGSDPYSWPLPVAPAGDLVLLSAGDARHGVELFRSVVPGADLELVEDLAFDHADSQFDPGVEVAGELYLQVDDRVLRTDGSREGTAPLLDLYISDCFPTARADLRPVGSRLLIAQRKCSEGDLWSYDPATRELAPLFGDSRPDRPPFQRIFDVVDGRADLLTGTYQPPAAQIWTSDATEAGTFALFSFPGGITDVSRAGDLRVILSDQIYVWQPGDADVRATQENLFTWFRSFGVAGERAILEAGDLSNAASVLIAVAADGSIETLVSFEAMSWVRGRERLGDVVLFLVERGGTGALELWVTDGTAAGTRALRGFDSPTQSSDQVRRLVPLGDRLAFLGFSPTGAIELWASDGTVAGTNFLDRLGDDETTTLVAWIASTGTRVFVSGYRATAEGTSDLDVLRLWSSPDAHGGATLVAEWTFPTNDIFYGFDPFLEPFAFDGRVYFVGASTRLGRRALVERRQRGGHRSRRRHRARTRRFLARELRGRRRPALLLGRRRPARARALELRPLGLRALPRLVDRALPLGSAFPGRGLLDRLRRCPGRRDGRAADLGLGRLLVLRSRQRRAGRQGARRHRPLRPPLGLLRRPVERALRGHGARRRHAAPRDATSIPPAPTPRSATARRSVRSALPRPRVHPRPKRSPRPPAGRPGSPRARRAAPAPRARRGSACATAASRSRPPGATSRATSASAARRPGRAARAAPSGSSTRPTSS